MTRRELVNRLRSLAIAIESGDSMKMLCDEALHGESDSVLALIKMANRVAKAVVATPPAPVKENEVKNDLG
jgi:hypothetical protein